MVKKLLLIVLLIPILLSIGCNLTLETATIFGTWEMINGVSTAMLVLNSNETFTIDTFISGVPDYSDSGTFIYTESTMELIGVGQGSSGVLLYTLDGDTLILNGLGYLRQ
jgi:hypothetical protein